jgi:predicted nucleic acid-binding protein
MVIYLDTSALLKKYVTEVGSNWLHALLTPPQPPLVFISQLAIVEATCAFARRFREGSLTPADHTSLLAAFDYDIAYSYYLQDFVPTTIDAARRLAYLHPLRAYDAVHLATAWLINQELIADGQPPLTFIAADNRLLTAAKNEGLLIENPNDHP